MCRHLGHALGIAERAHAAPFAGEGNQGRGVYRSLGAIEEKVIAHALVFEEFERLAAEAAEPAVNP